jgi:hypothetical protein
MKKMRRALSLLLGLLLGPLFLSACEDEEEAPQVVVVTNTVTVPVNQDEPETESDEEAVPESQILFDQTFEVEADGFAISDGVTTPGKGTVVATIEWEGGGFMDAYVMGTGAEGGFVSESSPIILSNATDADYIWQVSAENKADGPREIRITIEFVPED